MNPVDHTAQKVQLVHICFSGSEALPFGIYIFSANFILFFSYVLLITY